MRRPSVRQNLVFALFYRFFPFLLCFLCAKGGEGQTRTIINTEKSEPAPDKGLHGSANANGTAATGNIELININADGMFGYRKPKYWLRLLGGSTFYKQDGIKALDNNYLQGRYSRFFGKESLWQSYHFAQYQSNHTLILKERGIIGSGVRRSFPFQDTGHFDIGGGIMWEYERLDEGSLEEYETAIHRNWRFTSVFVFRRALNEQISILNTAYFQPKVDDLADIRTLEELSFLTQLTERFQFDITFYWRVDSKPPEAIVPSDFGVNLGVLLEL